MIRVFLSRGECQDDPWVWFIEDANGEYLDTLEVPCDPESGDYDIHSATLCREMARASWNLSDEQVDYIDGDYGPIATLTAPDW